MSPPNPVLDGPQPEDLVLWELVQTAQVVAKAFRTVFAAAQLTPSQFGVLAHLAEGDDLSKAELARAVLVTPQSMDPLIETLLAAGLVTRDRPPRRGRAAGITITPAGLRRFTSVLPAVNDLNSPERTGIPTDQVPLLIAQLRTVRTTLRP